ncbi:MAG: DNA-protecting protein DprA [Candidatus Schekmanbacteria bacterium]|nr:DNA-protecting protein DprA [Candidatus Schekmanbacteria bacterium]
MTVPGIGWAAIRRLRRCLGPLDRVPPAAVAQLRVVEGIPGRLLVDIADALSATPCSATAERLATEYRLLEAHSASIVLRGERRYPPSLQELYDPPELLFAQGDYEPARDPIAVAIVGTRWPTAYGRLVAGKLAAELSALGITIVSGLARGIDAEAHSAALRPKGGRTIAVLGSGLGKLYPTEHAELAERISENGAILSELLPSTPPRPGHFPRRNRIIAALGLGVVVVEAPERSGALITAREAIDVGRDVFAIPGNVTSRNSIGSNRLIKDGAYLVEDFRDIISVLEPRIRRFTPPAPRGSRPGDAPDQIADSGDPRSLPI